MIDIEEEVSETFTLIQPASPVSLDDLPLSPKKTFRAAAACGWEVRAWLGTGEFAPTLYASSSEESGYNIGDVKSDGYVGRMIVVEARDMALPLGFRAHYFGKQYEDARKSPAGSFSSAFVVDPVGLPVELSATYKPIPVHRGKYETQPSWQLRVNSAQAMADEQAAAYNDGTTFFQNKYQFNKAGDFDSWLAEWRSFVPTTFKEANHHA